MDGKEKSLQATVVAGLVMVAVAVVLLIGCSSSDSSPADFELTTALDLDQIDPEILQLADAAVERFGDEGGFSAVMLALERGYSVDQLLAAPDALNEDGTVDGVAPAGPRAGQFDVSPAETEASPALTPPAAADPTSTPVPTVPTVAPMPTRIVSLSPLVTELVFELRLGGLIVAAMASADNPLEAPELDVFPAIESLDQIIAQNPDLVIMDISEPELIDALNLAGIETLAVGRSSSADEGFALVTQLGELLNASNAADKLNSQIRADVGFGASELPTGPLRIYHEYYLPGSSHIAATSDSFIGEVYAAAGYVNIADEFDVGLGFGFLSDADIVRANPDIIVIEGLPRDLPFSIGQDRPSWTDLNAVRSRAMILFDEGQPSRFGPRAGTFIGAVASQAQLANPGGN